MYAAYVLVSVGLTVWVARTLLKGGRVFLVDVFHGNDELADSVNHLLVVGFYLINLGYVALALKVSTQVDDAQTAVEALSTKLGLVLLVLGAMHFGNLYVFSRLRRRSLYGIGAPPPIEPDECLTPDQPQPPRGPTGATGQQPPKHNPQPKINPNSGRPIGPQQGAQQGRQGTEQGPWAAPVY